LNLRKVLNLNRVRLTQLVTMCTFAGLVFPTNMLCLLNSSAVRPVNQVAPNVVDNNQFDNAHSFPTKGIIANTQRALLSLDISEAFFVRIAHEQH
jgi:hypothetical protein